MTITKDTIIGDILNIAPETAPLFMNIGMHCLPRYRPEPFRHLAAPRADA